MDKKFPGMRELAERLFAVTPAEQKDRLILQLTRYVNEAQRRGVAGRMDWSRETLATLESKFGAKRRRAAARQQRFSEPQNGAAAPAPTYVDAPLTSTVRGTSTQLEKPYFRLTGQVNPAVVRPPEVLEKSLRLVLRRYLGERALSYAYVKEQLQSIRQDLTVQHCESAFARRVYETNVLIALYHNDLGEFNKCLARLLAMHQPAEFLAYHVLYMLVLQQWSSIAELECAQTAPIKAYEPQERQLQEQQQQQQQPQEQVYREELTQPKSKAVQQRMYARALALAECVLARDHLRLEQVARDALPLERRLVQLVLDRERPRALRALLSALGGQRVALCELGAVSGIPDVGAVLRAAGAAAGEWIECGEALAALGAQNTKVLIEERAS